MESMVALDRISFKDSTSLDPGQICSPKKNLPESFGRFGCSPN